jgi:hypothetical protein
MTREEYIKSRAFWTLALQYLSLVENAARETVDQGNVSGLVTDYKDGEPTVDDYFEKTRWSDHRLIMPLLFNLYHGFELLVKGFLLARKPEVVEAHHGIQEWVEQFAQLFPMENDLRECFLKYTQPDRLPKLITQFLSDNQLQFGQLYEALRYPTDKKFDNIKRYIQLKYKGTEGLPFFKELLIDLNRLRIAAVRLGRSIEGELGQQMGPGDSKTRWAS